MKAHEQKPYFAFRRNGRVHLNRRGASVQSTTGSRGVHFSGSNAGHIMFRGSVKSTGYLVHSPFSPFTSPPVRHRVLSHFNWSLQMLSKRSCTSCYKLQRFPIRNKQMCFLYLITHTNKYTYIHLMIQNLH